MAETGSPISHNIAGRKRIADSRRLLGLGRRGVPQPQLKTPAQAPAPGPAPGPTSDPKTEQAIEGAKLTAPEAVPVEQQGQAPLTSPLDSMPADQRREVMAQAAEVTLAMKKQKRARLHRVLGPSRRFMGGGL